MATTTSRTKAVSAAAALLVLLLVVGLVGVRMVGGQTARPDATGVLEIEVSGFAFSPDDLTIPADTAVSLVFRNTSEVTHNVAIGRQPVSEAGRVVGFGEDLLALAGARATPSRALLRPGDPALPSSINVHPDEEVTVSVTVPSSLAGEWEIGCMVGPGCDPRLREGARLLVE